MIFNAKPKNNNQIGLIHKKEKKKDKNKKILAKISLLKGIQSKNKRKRKI